MLSIAVRWRTEVQNHHFQVGNDNGWFEVSRDAVPRPRVRRGLLFRRYVLLL